MRTVSKSEDPGRSSDRKRVFRAAFRRHCHELLAIGYAKLDAASLRDEEETVITGKLALAMNYALESSDAPTWAAYFIVLDDPPVNAPGRTGKRRRRVDIEVVKTQRGKRPRFQFEAKRLCHSGSVTEYVGPDGMGLFLAGEYARNHPEAGMLGYVQDRTPNDWAAKIEERLSGDRTKYGVTNDGDFRQQNLTPALDNTYHSAHDRPSVGRPISIFHTFLRFN